MLLLCVCVVCVRVCICVCVVCVCVCVCHVTQALDAWRVARIRGLVLERWHFMARRAAQIIARAGKYKHLPGKTLLLLRMETQQRHCPFLTVSFCSYEPDLGALCMCVGQTQVCT